MPFKRFSSSRLYAQRPSSDRVIRLHRSDNLVGCKTLDVNRRSKMLCVFDAVAAVTHSVFFFDCVRKSSKSRRWRGRRWRESSPAFPLYLHAETFSYIFGISFAPINRSSSARPNTARKTTPLSNPSEPSAKPFRSRRCDHLQRTERGAKADFRDGFANRLTVEHRRDKRVFSIFLAAA